MTLISYDTFNSVKTYFILITLLIEYRKELAKVTAKVKETRQFSKTNISDSKLECSKMFLMKFS